MSTYRSNLEDPNIRVSAPLMLPILLAGPPGPQSSNGSPARRWQERP